MTDRRYSEAEVREIFDEAARKRATREPAALPTAQGLTLADMQEIGQEVGLAPAEIARAAAMLDARGLELPRRRSLGMPVGVGRMVPLPRALTDYEWEQLVAELRATFHARGKVSSHGASREWSNGNLHAVVEPAESGYRLRLGTLKSDGTGWNALGIFGVTAGFAGLLAGPLFGFSNVSVVVPALGGSGLIALLSNAVRLPRWARARERQMQDIANKVAAIMKTTGDTSPNT